MNSGSIQFTQIMVIVIGIYCFFRGILTLATGKIPEREEARLGSLTENGLKKYKLLSAVMNIIGGVFITVIFVVRMLNLIEMNTFRMIALAILAVMIVAYVLIRNSCKNTK